MRARRLITAATLFWAGVLGWAVLIPNLPVPSSALHAAAGDDEHRGSRSNDRSDDRSNDRSDDRSGGRDDDRSNGHSDDRSNSDGQLNADLKHVLKKARFTGKIESTLEARLGRRLNPKLANLGRLLWFDNVAFARPGQHVRRLPLADERLWRHAVHRDRRAEQQHGRSASHRPAQSAPIAARRQHGVPAQADVERPIQRAVRRSVRQLGRLSVSAARRRRRRFPRTIRS